MAVQCVATQFMVAFAKNENVMFKCPMMYCFHFLYLLWPVQFLLLCVCVSVCAAATAAAIDAIAHVVANENIYIT